MSEIRNKQGVLNITLDGNYHIPSVNPTTMGNPQALVHCTYRGTDEEHPSYKEAVANTLLCQEAFRVACEVDRTPRELLSERDEWEDEATRLHREIEVLERRRERELNGYIEHIHDQQIVLDEALEVLRFLQRTREPDKPNSILSNFLRDVDDKKLNKGKDENQ